MRWMVRFEMPNPLPSGHKYFYVSERVQPLPDRVKAHFTTAEWTARENKNGRCSDLSPCKSAKEKRPRFRGKIPRGEGEEKNHRAPRVR